jgi:hypothetical protein
LQDSAYIENYHEYLIRELPSVFRRFVQETVYNESNPIEENIRDQATSLIPAALNIVYHTYRATLDPNPSQEEIPTRLSERTAVSTLAPSVLEICPESPAQVANAEVPRGLSRMQTSQTWQTRLDGVPSSSDSAYLSGNSNSGDNSSGNPRLEKNSNTTVGSTGNESQPFERIDILTSDRSSEHSPHPSMHKEAAPESNLSSIETPQSGSLPVIQNVEDMFASGNNPIGNGPQFYDEFGNVDLTPADLYAIDWDGW